MFRPWGLVNWALGLSATRRWHFIGCLGPEERSIVSYVALAKRKRLKEQTLLCIEEVDSPYADDAAECIQKRAVTCRKARLKPNVIKHALLGPITAVDPLCDAATSSVILDITSLPKRYFFYLLKTFFLSASVKDLVITYTLPSSYPSAALTENHDLWDALPTFRQADPKLEETAHRRLIVNVGFMPDGLIAHLEGRAEEKQIDLIIPFPAPVPAVQRAWRSVWALTSTPYEARFNETRVDANDMSEAFDVILSLVPQDTNLVSFAPFGPKPISAAMCLYSSLTGSPVYYSQPKVYRPDYSLGVLQTAGENTTFAYWVKHDGKKLFELPSERRSLVK